MEEPFFDVKVTCGRDELGFIKLGSRQIMNLLYMLPNIDKKSPTFYMVDAPKIEIWAYQEDEDGESN